MKFLVKNARGKIIDDAEKKRDELVLTFQVRIKLILQSNFDWDISGASPQQI